MEQDPETFLLSYSKASPPSVASPRPLSEEELLDYEPLPQNPSLLIKKQRPKSSPPVLQKPTRECIFIPPTSLKTQTVRSNLEKYQIEKVLWFDETTLKRIRFLIESKTAQTCHLSMLSVLEYSSIPSSIIQEVFGSQVKTLYGVKVLLCRAIEEKNKLIGKVTKSMDTICIDERVMLSRPPSAVSRTRVTTPQPLLDIIDSANPSKRKPKKVNWKKVETLVSDPQYRPQRDEVDRRQLLGSILFAKKLGLRQ